MKICRLHFLYVYLQTIGLTMLCSLHSHAQSSGDSSVYQKAVNASIDSYNQTIKENLALFNGPQYLFVSKQSYGFPFWKADSLVAGDVDYAETHYENIPMKYDLVNQTVVITNYSHSALIALLTDKIKSFTINNHQFYKLDVSSNNYKNIETGFYDKLYSGKVNVWARREKKLVQAQNAEDQSANFIESNQYYIQIGNIFYLITEKANLINTLKNEAEIETFITNNKMKFNDDIENELIKIAMFYEQLKK